MSEKEDSLGYKIAMAAAWLVGFPITVLLLAFDMLVSVFICYPIIGLRRLAKWLTEPLEEEKQ